MDYGTEMTELQARIKRLEDQVKVFRFLFIIVCIWMCSQVWLQSRPGIMRARQVDVVDATGKTVAELGQENGRAHLTLYGAASKPAAEFSVVGSEPSIVFYDGEQKQRAILGMLVGAPTLAMHDAGGDVRALLTADPNGSNFWLKGKDGSATILGNAIDETRRIEKIDGKVVPHDTVQISSGTSIRIQDAKRTILWKAP
jgi:hypothetical protein